MHLLLVLLHLDKSFAPLYSSKPKCVSQEIIRVCWSRKMGSKRERVLKHQTRTYCDMQARQVQMQRVTSLVGEIGTFTGCF